MYVLYSTSLRCPGSYSLQSMRVKQWRSQSMTECGSCHTNLNNTIISGVPRRGPGGGGGTDPPDNPDHYHLYGHL